MISFSMQFANENKYFINLLNFSYVRTTHSCECEMICVWHMHDSNVMFKQLSFSPNRCVETVVNFMRSMTTIWRCFRFSNKFLFRNFFCLSNSLCFEYLICLLQTVNVNEINQRTFDQLQKHREKECFHFSCIPPHCTVKLKQKNVCSIIFTHAKSSGIFQSVRLCW